MIDLNFNLVTDLKMLLVAWSNYNLVPLVSLKQQKVFNEHYETKMSLVVFSLV